MLAIVSADEMQAAEAAAKSPEGELMLRAASGIANWISSHASSTSNRPPVVAALVGPGNNGGDALCALGLLAEQGWTALALPVLRSEVGELPVGQDALDRIEWIAEVGQIAGADVILDGIFGIGSRAELPAEVRGVTSEVNRIRKTRSTLLVAIDLPTGVNSDEGRADNDAVQADVTLAISFPKAGMLREPAATAVGDLEIIDIGIPTPESHQGAWMSDERFVRGLLPRRNAAAHKHSIGGVLIAGGAPNYYGAPRLSGAAALRAGAGYVGMAVPRSIIASTATAIPEVVYHPLSDGDGRRSAAQLRTALGETGERYRSIVIGPGLGRDEVASNLLESLLPTARSDSQPAPADNVGFGIPRRQSVLSGGDEAPSSLSDRALVLDADALYWLAQQNDWLSTVRDLNAILTPHAGELARLRGVDISDVHDRSVEIALETAKESGQVVVLKYCYSCACAPDGRVVHAPRSTPELATPGTGDALAGLLGAFLAMGLDRFDAAAAGLYVGAMAGRRARRTFGTYSVTASDLIDAIPAVLRELTEPALNREDI